MDNWLEADRIGKERLQRFVDAAAADRRARRAAAARPEQLSDPAGAVVRHALAAYAAVRRSATAALRARNPRAGDASGAAPAVAGLGDPPRA